MLWFAVHFPRLGLEIFERRHPDETASPAVLVEDGRVRLTNVPARQAGIVPGSTLATAHGVAARLRHFERDLPAELEQLHRLAETAYRYTSHVSVCAPDGLVLDMHGSRALFDGLFDNLGAIAEDLEELFADIGHASRIAFAHTPAGALTLARAGKRPAVEGPVPAAALEALRGVSLACTEIAPRNVERLANMGVFRIGQLLALPRDELGARFGPALQDCLSRLTGETADPRTPIVPRESFASSVHLIEAVSNKQTLLFPMRRLTAELAAWLGARQLGAMRLVWGFHPLHGAPCHVETRFASPRADARGILEIARLRLEQADLPEETMSIELVAAETAPRASSAGGLFATEAGTGVGTGESRAVARMELVDAIEARLGDAALRCLVLADDHRPERAWTSRRPGRKPGGVSRMSTEVSAAPGLRPLWFFDPPRPVRIHRFRLLAGPERIESGWWDDAVARDYYVALGEDGAQCWLFHTRGSARPRRRGVDSPSDDGWFLHGYFS